MEKRKMEGRVQLDSRVEKILNVILLLQRIECFALIHFFESLAWFL